MRASAVLSLVGWIVLCDATQIRTGVLGFKVPRPNQLDDSIYTVAGGLFLGSRTHGLFTISPSLPSLPIFPSPPLQIGEITQHMMTIKTLDLTDLYLIVLDKMLDGTNHLIMGL